jgi:hypothetical protein
MKAVRRTALWTAFLLLVLATISWAGIVLVAPYYFLLPGIALAIVIGFVTIVARAARPGERDGVRATEQRTTV